MVSEGIGIACGKVNETKPKPSKLMHAVQNTKMLFMKTIGMVHTDTKTMAKDRKWSLEGIARRRPPVPNVHDEQSARKRNMQW